MTGVIVLQFIVIIFIALPTAVEKRKKQSPKKAEIGKIDTLTLAPPKPIKGAITDPNPIPEGGYIPDPYTALKVGEPVLRRVFGTTIDKYKPLM